MGPQTICAVIARSRSSIKICSLAKGIRATVSARGKRKSLNLQYYVTDRISEISTTIKDLKDARIPTSVYLFGHCKIYRDHGE